MERPPVEIEEAVYLPTDLSNWVSKAQLREWIVEHVNSMNWDNPELKMLLLRNPDFEPRELLCTITLAYAIGAFAAEDVMRSCSRDPQFRSIRPKLPPRTDDFSTFRKLNRVLINEVLQHVITRALKTQFIDADEFVLFPAGLRRMIAENAAQRLDFARHMDRGAEI